MTRKNKKKFYIWEGVYDSFVDAPNTGLGFSSNIWIKKSMERTQNMLEMAKERKTVPEFVIYRENLLPILASIVGSQRKVVKILDFGGNLGREYLSTIHSSSIKPSRISYTVVENSHLCALGTKIFKGNKRIRFIYGLPKPSTGIDIIHVGSTLQYIENWKDMIVKLSKFKSPYILLTDLQAGNIPTFVTVQNYYESKIPSWFFNINQIIKTFNRQGYELIHKSTYRGTFLGVEQDKPQENLPKKYRLKNSCNLIFRKKSP